MYHRAVSRRRTLLVRIAAIVLIAAGLWLFVHRLAWDELGRALSRAEPWPLAGAAVLNFVHMFGMAVAWRIMLAPRYRVSALRILRYTIASFAASALAPARAGELLRVWALRRRDGVAISDGAAVALGEKLLDAVTLLALVTPMPWLLPELPAWVGRTIFACATLLLAAFAVLYLIVGRADPGAPSWLARFFAGLHVVRSGKRLAAAAAMLTLTWLVDLGTVTLVLDAVGLAIPVAARLCILFALNLTSMLPSTPAQVGALELGVLAATRMLRIPDEPAFAFALLYHAIQVIPVIGVGLVLELPLVLGREARSEISDPA